MTSEILSNRELRRYNNQIALPGIGLNGQKKIKKAGVVVIGTGGIGTSVMQHLVAAGIGSLGIVDNAMVEEANIHRQTVYGTSDLGKQKAIITKQKLRDLNAQVNLNIHNLCISMGNLNQICTLYDIVIDASNHLETSKAIAEYCEGCNKSLIFGRAVEFNVEIGVFNDCSKLKANVDQLNNEVEKDGFLSAIGGITGAILALEALKMIAGIESNNMNRIKKFNTLEILK